MKIEVKKVLVLGVPAGNLWDVYFDGQLVGRVTYHGNELVTLRGMIGQRRAVERAIDALYARPLKDVSFARPAKVVRPYPVQSDGYLRAAGIDPEAS